jgi:hypothetical protein
MSTEEKSAAEKTTLQLSQDQSNQTESKTDPKPDQTDQQKDQQKDQQTDPKPDQPKKRRPRTKTDKNDKTEKNDDENQYDDDDSKQRGPGRPRKTTPRKQLPRHGLTALPTNSSEPESVQHAVELVYENPLMFKKIFTLFKTYSVESINMLFEKDRVYMYSINQNSEVKLLTELFCDRLNQYYNSKPIVMNLNTEYFYNIFQSVNKDNTRIIFLTTNENCDSKLWVILVDDCDEKSIYEVRLNPVKDTDIVKIRDILINEKTYPISFELTSKFLKHKITEYLYLKAKKLSIDQTIDESGNREISFSCGTTDNRIDNRSPLSNVNRMNFISTYDQPLFVAPITIANIRPFTNTMICDKIKLSVDEKRDLILTTCLDYDIDPVSKENIINSEKCKIRIAISLVKSLNEQ